MPSHSSSPTRDVLVYGSSPWDETWLTEHFLSDALGRVEVDGRRVRVLFVDPAFSLLTPFRRASGLAALRSAVGLVLDPRRRVEGGGDVTVLRTTSLPPKENRWARRVSAPWRRLQVRRAIRAGGYDIGLVVTCAAFDESTEIPVGARTVAVVKDWLAAGAHLTGLSAETILERQRRTWARADVVCAISTRLQRRVAEEGVDARLLRHGSLRAAGPVPGTAPVPAPLAGLPRPLLGAVGRIDARWDLAALAAVAEQHPEGSLLLIGPVSPRLQGPARVALDALAARPNVHLLPAVANTELGAWTEAMDVTLVPYVDDPWQEFASPLKIWDYFRAGTPIAATGCPALGEFPAGLVHFRLPSRELAEAVEEALAEPAEHRARRTAYAAANTWDHRAAELLALAAPTP
ncbi:glycosyltransferase [Kineococcus gynurae]|uniref:Glycosyltransferase n=1 Tax=Kineococcus gynurae TaxID=452979 RepID=A0ABV5LWY0_9ACTN